jgi:hypothetical protein
MIESIKHFLGLCGEPHGLLYTILSISSFSGFLAYLKYKMR